MATIMSLPNEIILIILKKLSIKDIENFSATCKKFRQTEWGNILWIKTFYERWPTMKKVYTSMKSEDFQQIDFKKQLKENAKFAKEMWDFVHHVFMDNLNNDNKRDLVSKFLCSNVYSTNYFLLLDEFKRMFSQSAREPGHDLTRRFNSRIIFRLLKHSRTRYKYLKFINKPKEHQFLEQLVTIVVQWFTPLNHVSYSNIQALLDKIAQQVLQALREECPTHPILTVANEYYIYWKTNNIDCSYWNFDEILPISFITEKIIFSQIYFHKLNQLWLRNLNQDVNNVSGGSERLFLLTIYHSVLRRFGIYSLIIGGGLLQIFLRPMGSTSRLRYYSLDLRYGRFCLVPNNHSIDATCHYKTITKLVDYLENELQTLHPGEVIMLNRMLLGQYINISEIMMWFCDSTIPKKRILAERSPKVKFVIGTIVTHRCVDEIHIGVIVGWTLYYYPPACMMRFNNFPLFYLNILCTNWKCTDSTCNTHKPHYIILCENNLYCYVEHDNVSKCNSPRWVNHKEIGRYFYRFEGNYYVPNEMLAADYPSDVAIINEMRRDQLH